VPVFLLVESKSEGAPASGLSIGKQDTRGVAILPLAPEKRSTGLGPLIGFQWLIVLAKYRLCKISVLQGAGRLQSRFFEPPSAPRSPRQDEFGGETAISLFFVPWRSWRPWRFFM